MERGATMSNNNFEQGHSKTYVGGSGVWVCGTGLSFWSVNFRLSLFCVTLFVVVGMDSSHNCHSLYQNSCRTETGGEIICAVKERGYRDGRNGKEFLEQSICYLEEVPRSKPQGSFSGTLQFVLEVRFGGRAVY